MSKPPSKNASDREQEGAPRIRSRRFTVPEKLRLLAEVDRCENTEQVERVLRREGLPGSRLRLWRKQLASNAAPADKATRLSRDERKRVILRLQREKAALERELVAARELLARDRPHPSPPDNEQPEADSKRRRCG